MKELPILFSTPMVQSILKDGKSMTRRTNGLEEINENPEYYWLSKEKFVDKKGRFCQKFFSAKGNPLAICPYGSVGDILWVREKFRFEEAFDYDGDHFPDNYWYYASTPEKFECVDGTFEERDDYKWKPSIHMPKEAARIWLDITDIKPERLHDISREDCRKEGIEQIGATYKNYLLTNTSTYNERISFQTLWVLINGVESWDKNPWVWAISFKLFDTIGKLADL